MITHSYTIRVDVARLWLVHGRNQGEFVGFGRPPSETKKFFEAILVGRGLNYADDMMLLLLSLTVIRLEFMLHDCRWCMVGIRGSSLGSDDPPQRQRNFLKQKKATPLCHVHQSNFQNSVFGEVQEHLNSTRLSKDHA